MDEVTTTAEYPKEVVENNFRKLFGALMRLKRVHHQLTQDELCLQSGISRPTLSKIESSRDGARNSTFQRIADALNIQPEELQLLKHFAKAHDPDDGVQILLSREFIDAIGHIKIASIIEEANEIGSKTPNTNKNPKMLGRTALAIAILRHSEILPKCRPSWN